jgi:hypothetical protein
MLRCASRRKRICVQKHASLRTTSLLAYLRAIKLHSPSLTRRGSRSRASGAFPTPAGTRSTLHILLPTSLAGNPWVTHPAYCVCSRCKKRRTPDEWDRAVRVRIDRVSPFTTEAESIANAVQLRETEEARLSSELDHARAEQRAIGTRVSFAKICNAYRDYQLREGRRLDRDQYRLAVLEDFFGSDRDVLSIDRREAEHLRLWLTSERQVGLATVERYLATLIAALNSAVKDGLIESHRLHGLRRSRLARTFAPGSSPPPASHSPASVDRGAI